MKLFILVIVSLIATNSIDCRDVPHSDIEDRDGAQYLPVESEGKDLDDINSSDEDNQQMEERSNSNAEEPEHLDSIELYQEFEEVEKVQSKKKLRRSTCKARNACVVMGGFCVTNATLCSGRLVPEGCKGPNCQCCVPGTLEQKIQELEDELNSMKHNLTKDNLEIKTELHSMKDNITDVISNQGCQISSGFFIAPGSNQCLKVFLDKLRTWPEADTKCKSAGLVLVKPYDAVSLNKYMVERYYANNQWYWIGARGDGSHMKWQRDDGLGQSILTSSSSLWLSGYPGSRTSSSYCLQLAAAPSYLKSQPDKPYYINSCTGDREYALCELIME